MPNETEENKGLRLLKKGQKGIIHAVFSRLGIILLLLILQILFLVGVFYWFGDLVPHFWGGTILFSACMVLYLINSRIDPTAKITWLIVIMLMPIFGALLFWFTQSELGHRALKSRVDQLIQQTNTLVPQDPDTLEHLKEEEPGAAGLAAYINRTGCHPVYENTSVTYFPMG